MNKKELKEQVLDYLFNDKELTNKAIKKLLDISGDYVQDIEPDENFVRVELPYTNVGPIYIQKKFKDVALKIDHLADILYEKGEAANAGYEYFSTICALIDCDFVQDFEEEIY
jgi:hypothetical protein